MRQDEFNHARHQANMMTDYSKNEVPGIKKVRTWLRKIHPHLKTYNPSMDYGKLVQLNNEILHVIRNTEKKRRRKPSQKGKGSFAGNLKRVIRQPRGPIGPRGPRTPPFVSYNIRGKPVNMARKGGGTTSYEPQKGSGRGNPWIEYVKQYAKEHGISYPKALREAGPSYRAKKGGGQKGGGFISNLKKKIKSVWKKHGKTVKKVVGDAVTAVRKEFNTNPKSTEPLPGEIHAVELQGPYKGSSYNFMGPGTQVEKRVERGDRGINPPDEAARQHDLDYVEIGKIPSDDKEAIRKAVIDADVKFLKAIYPYRNLQEVKVALAAISAKVAAQEAGKLPWSKFTSQIQ